MMVSQRQETTTPKVEAFPPRFVRVVPLPKFIRRAATPATCATCGDRFPGKLDTRPVMGF